MSIVELKEFCNNRNVKFAISTAYADGSNGALDLANLVLTDEINENLEIVETSGNQNNMLITWNFDLMPNEEK